LYKFFKSNVGDSDFSFEFYVAFFLYKFLALLQKFLSVVTSFQSSHMAAAMANFTTLSVLSKKRQVLARLRDYFAFYFAWEVA
jgi:hypothetical protein